MLACTSENCCAHRCFCVGTKGGKNSNNKNKQQRFADQFGNLEVKYRIVQSNHSLKGLFICESKSINI